MADLSSHVCPVCGGPVFWSGDGAEPEPGRISAKGCDYHAEHGNPKWRDEWTRAAATIRALEQERDAQCRRANLQMCEVAAQKVRAEKLQGDLDFANARVEKEEGLVIQYAKLTTELQCQIDKLEDDLKSANARAEKAEAANERGAQLDDARMRRIRELEQSVDNFREQRDTAEAALAALRAETADLLEVKRCKSSIEAAGLTWIYGSYSGSDVAWWQEKERAAWEHAAAPYRARVEAVGWTLTIRDDRQYPDCDSRQIMLTWSRGSSSEIEFFGDPGSSPTLAALEEAAAWAEAHPANRGALDMELVVNPQGTVTIGDKRYAIKSASITVPGKDAVQWPKDPAATAVPAKQVCPKCGKRCERE